MIMLKMPTALRLFAPPTIRCVRMVSSGAVTVRETAPAIAPLTSLVLAGPSRTRNFTFGHCTPTISRKPFWRDAFAERAVAPILPPSRAPNSTSSAPRRSVRASCAPVAIIRPFRCCNLRVGRNEKLALAPGRPVPPEAPGPGTWLLRADWVARAAFAEAAAGFSHWSVRWRPMTPLICVVAATNGTRLGATFGPTPEESAATVAAAAAESEAMAADSGGPAVAAVREPNGRARRATRGRRPDVDGKDEMRGPVKDGSICHVASSEAPSEERSNAIVEEGES
eukprot:TRINITY_DN10180_c0_g4_i2.p2 TRINITY_DN10180_c0_g4~~TRINITY_DN10180_c0_g4_i2.p2  ORF type:complete len:282 (+),score=-24.45 TRINITY_DN10180_c0_g4_i2:1044-1889(+)